MEKVKVPLMSKQQAIMYTQRVNTLNEENNQSLTKMIGIVTYLIGELEDFPDNPKTKWFTGPVKKHGNLFLNTMLKIVRQAGLEDVQGHKLEQYATLSNAINYAIDECITFKEIEGSEK